MCPRLQGAGRAGCRPRTPPPPDPELDLRMFEALPCAFVARAGGFVRLPVQKVADCANGLQLCLRSARSRDAVELAVAPQPPPAGRRAHTPRRRAP